MCIRSAISVTTATYDNDAPSSFERVQDESKKSQVSSRASTCVRRPNLCLQNQYEQPEMLCYVCYFSILLLFLLL